MSLTWVVKMRFGNTPAERDTAVWEVYSSSKNWNLTSGADKKTVYGEFENTSGDFLFIQDDIILETASSTLWYDASDSTSITETLWSVSQWNDKSWNNYHLKQGDIARQAKLLSTGEIDFNGITDYFYIENLNYTNTKPLDGLLVCTVFRTANTSNSLARNWSFLDFDRSEWFNFYNRWPNMWFSYDSDGSIQDIITSGIVVNDNNWHVGCASYDNSITNDTVVTIDGNTGFSWDIEPNGAQIWVGQQTRFWFVWDGSEAATENAGRNNVYYDGTIGEIIYFDTAISAWERKTLECNLWAKWWVSISGCTGIGNSPIASVEYIPETTTSGNVIASLTNQSEAITVTNNGGSSSYTFTTNGIFIFEFIDSDGNIWTVTARVDWIDDTTPLISSTNFPDNTLLPGGNHDVSIDYSDSDSWIDTASSSFELYKWDGVSVFWADIAGTNSSSWSITTTQANYSLNNLSFWKYRYIFTISDIAGNTSSETRDFYIDEPEFIVSDELIDIWDVYNFSESFSNTVTLTVKTVGAGFDVSMNMPVPSLNYSPNSIAPWNGTTGFWFALTPYTSISAIWTNQLIATQVKNINTNGEKNTYTYDLKLWALVEMQQASWDYMGNIDFGIELGY